MATLMLVAASCGGSSDAEEVDGFGPGGTSPEAAVRALVGHLDAAEFSEASDLSVPGHAALASLAEGASFSAVASALALEDTTVAANFWAGFAQGSALFLQGEIVTEDDEIVTHEGLEFHGVLVMPEGNTERVMYTRDVDGWRIDVFASFGAGLAGRMVPQVERVLAADTDDARLIRAELSAIVPSLHVAAASDELPPQFRQEVLKLIEVISRTT